MVEHLISSTVLPMAVGESFTNYRVIPGAFDKLEVSGLEFTFLPEWDPVHPPLGRTAADWESCPKPTTEELVEMMEEISIPIVHINRDVGNLLCSGDKERIERGKDILESNLKTAEEFDSRIAVIHLWDTRSEQIDLEELWNKVDSIADKHEDLAIAIENVPISSEGYDVKRAWNELSYLMDERHGFTLDLNWCSFYDNFEELREFKDKILDVHL